MLRNIKHRYQRITCIAERIKKKTKKKTRSIEGINPIGINRIPNCERMNIK